MVPRRGATAEESVSSSRCVPRQPDVGGKWWQRAGELNVALEHSVGAATTAHVLAEQVDADGVPVLQQRRRGAKGLRFESARRHTAKRARHAAASPKGRVLTARSSGSLVAGRNSTAQPLMWRVRDELRRDAVSHLPKSLGRGEMAEDHELGGVGESAQQVSAVSRWAVRRRSGGAL